MSKNNISFVQQQQQQQGFEKDSKGKQAVNKIDFQLLEQFNSQALDINDPLLQDIEGDEADERKILEFIHEDVHEHNNKKRKRQQSEDEKEEDEDESENEDISKFELTKLLMSRMDAKQNDRYDTYRRTTINKSGLKKLTNQIFPHPLPPDLIVILSSISKLMIGEIIEKAKDVQLKFEKKRLIERNLLKKSLKLQKKDPSALKIEIQDLDKIPLKPEHVREAWRLYQLENQGILPNDSWRKQGGNGDGMLFR